MLAKYRKFSYNVEYGKHYKDVEVKLLFKVGKSRLLLERLHWSILRRVKGDLWLDILDKDTSFVVVGKGDVLYEIGLFDEYEDRYIIVGRQKGKIQPYGRGAVLLPCAEPLSTDKGLQKYFNCYIVKRRGVPLAAVYVSKGVMSVRDVVGYYKRQVAKVRESTRPAFVGINGDKRAVYTKRRWGTEGYQRTLVIYYRRRVFMIVSSPLAFKYRRLLADGVLMVDMHRKR